MHEKLYELGKGLQLQVQASIPKLRSGPSAAAARLDSIGDDLHQLAHSSIRMLCKAGYATGPGKSGEGTGAGEVVE